MGFLRVWVASCVAMACVVVTMSAQQSKPQFEVVSIKPYKDRVQLERSGVLPGGVFREKSTAFSLIAYAYELRPYQLSGGPDWIRKDIFAVDARAGDDVSEPAAKVMLQSLLEDRFKLIAHIEQRELRYLSLVLAHGDGHLGPYLRQVGERCTTEEIVQAQKQFPKRIADPDTKGGMMTGGCVDLDRMTLMMTVTSEIPVMDKTGLRGKFTFDMRYVGEGGPTLSGGFADALQDQLGLKLKEDRGPVSVMVIDSIQPPAEN